MTTFLYVLLALAVLLVMITVHEFGHYCAGKIFGFKINEFSIGFGPKLYQKTKKDGELFTVRLLPLGGYCAFEGEDEDGKENPEAMNNQPAWKRLIVLLSGVFFNFLFGVLTAAIYLMVCGYSTIMVTNVVSNNGVSTIGLQEGDIVVAIDGKNVEAYRSFSSMLSDYSEGEEFVVTVNRDGEIVDITTQKQLFPAFYYVSYSNYLLENLYVYNLETNEYELISESELEALTTAIISADTSVETEAETNESGEVITASTIGTGYALESILSNYYYLYNENYVSCSDENVIKLLLNGDSDAGISSCIAYASSGVGLGVIQQYVAMEYGFFESLAKAWPFCFYLCGVILSSLGGLFTGATGISDLGGTVTAISQIVEISSYGLDYFLLLLPLLAMNLAVFNILPIPSLDGARAVFVLIEIIFRRPVNRKVEGWIHTIGLFLLFGLVIFLDVYHFFIAAPIYFLRL